MVSKVGKNQILTLFKWLHLKSWKNEVLSFQYFLSNTGQFMMATRYKEKVCISIDNFINDFKPLIHQNAYNEHIMLMV